MKKSELTRLKKDIVSFLQEQVRSIDLTILFGSLASGHFNEMSSDVDVAFLCSEEMSNQRRWDLQEQLASRLSLNVDLVDMSLIDVVFRFQIVSTGVTLFKKDSLEMEQFLDKSYIDYIQLNEDRAEILENYR